SRNGSGLRPSSDLCRPPSRGNDLYENNRKITKDFYQRFLIPVTAALEESLTTEVGEQSPILETLQLISRSQEIDDGGRKTLIVVYGVLLWIRSRTTDASEADGETFYYLGFIYTLATLVATFAPLLNSAERPESRQVLGFFGLGLITTFVGLAGRIVFAQTAP